MSKKTKEGGKIVNLSVRRLMELYVDGVNGVLKCPINQRYMNPKEVKDGAKQYFAHLIFEEQFNQLPDIILEDIPEFNESTQKATLDMLIFTVRKVGGKKVIEYQDGQHRLAYLKSIISGDTKLVASDKFDKRTLKAVREMLERCKKENGVEDEITFENLPIDVQNDILDMEFTVKFQFMENEEDCRTVFLHANTCKAMSTSDMQKNAYVGCAFYDEIQHIVLAFTGTKKQKIENMPYISYLPDKYVKILKQLTTNYKGNDKNAKKAIKKAALEKFLYRLIQTSRKEAFERFTNNGKVWEMKSAEAIAYGTLEMYSKVKKTEARKIIKEALENLYRASKMIDDTSSAYSFFAGRLQLVPALIMLNKRLDLEIEKASNTKEKIEAENLKLFTYELLCNRSRLIEACNEFNDIIKSTYQNASNVKVIYNNVLIQNNTELFRLRED